MNREFSQQTEIGTGAPERKRPYPALLSVLQAEARSGPAPRLPWLKARLPGGPNYLRLKALVKELCESLLDAPGTDGRLVRARISNGKEFR